MIAPKSPVRDQSSSNIVAAENEVALRSADLRAQFSQLRPRILQALNRELGRIWHDPRAAALGSFDEAVILNGEGFSVYAVSVRGLSLFQERYIAGNVSDQLIVNPGKTVLRFRMFRQHFENEDFNSPRPLESRGEIDLSPAGQFFAGEDSATFAPIGRQDNAVFLALRSSPRTPYNWMYDADSLEPRYAVCVDPNITQLLFILNTFSKAGMPLPAELEQRLAIHPDFSVRWAIADYLLRNDPGRAVDRLRELADHDPELCIRAQRRISFLENLRQA